MASPSKIPRVDDAAAESIRDGLQLITYECLDESISRQQLSARAVAVASRAMSEIARVHRQKSALQRTVELLRGEVDRLKGAVKDKETQVDLLNAALAFHKDEVSDVGSQTCQDSCDVGSQISQTDASSEEEDYV